MELVRLYIPESTSLVGNERKFFERGHKPVIVDYRLEPCFCGESVSAEVLNYGIERALHRWSA